MSRFKLTKSTAIIVIQLFILLFLTFSLCLKSREAASESVLLAEDGDTPENGGAKKDYIHWVDFTVPSDVLEKAFRYDVNTCQEDIHLDWIELLSYLGAKYGGDFSNFKASDLDTLAEKLKNGETMEELAGGMKYYSYYKDAYTAVLGGLVGYFDEEIDAPEGSGSDESTQKVWVTKYGLKAFSPIAKNFPYSDYDDFGVARSYGYKRQHLGHDMMGQVGTPVIAVESGYVEALGWNQYGGWRIGIRSFDKKRYYYYAHLRKNYPYQGSLEVGSTVTAGDVIGYLGRTGYSATENTNNISTPHLHFGLQLIFDESQKEGSNEIWISCYELVKFLRMNQSTVVKIDGTKEWDRVYHLKDRNEQIPEGTTQAEEPASLPPDAGSGTPAANKSQAPNESQSTRPDSQMPETSPRMETGSQTETESQSSLETQPGTEPENRPKVREYTDAAKETGTQHFSSAPCLFFDTST